MFHIRRAWLEDVTSCANLAAELIGAERGPHSIRAAFDRRELLTASDRGSLVGLLAYRTDWFNCTLVTLVGVKPDQRRKGVARALYRAVEEASLSARLFSSVEETNTTSIRMHRALGFRPSGYVDNLPQGYRELIFYKRLVGPLSATSEGIARARDNGEPHHA